MNNDDAAREMRRLTSMRDRGMLSQAEYRARRALFLDGLAGFAPSAADVEPTRPPPVGRETRAPASSATAIPASARVQASSARRGARGTHRLVYQIGAAVGAVLGFIAWILWLWSA